MSPSNGIIGRQNLIRRLLMKKFICLTIALLSVVCAALVGVTAPAAQAEEAELRYYDGQLISTIASESIYYTSRDLTFKETPGGCPTFYPDALADSCGAVAGAEVVAFYDKYYTDLIPDWTSYYTSTGNYRIQDADHIIPMMEDLYYLMNTNVGGAGVTEEDFRTGLKTYVKNHNHRCSYTSVKSGSTLNYDSCVNAIDNKKVIVLFTTAGNVYDISQYSGYDTIAPYTINGNHIMIAYGYVQLKYYNGSSLIRTETFLQVATGFAIPSIRYYKINSTNLVSAYVVNME